MSRCDEALSGLGSLPPTSGAAELLNAYLRWATANAQRFLGPLTDESAQEFVYTRRYWTLVAAEANPHAPHIEQRLRQLVNTEVEEQRRRIEAIRNVVWGQSNYWKAQSRTYVVADTNVYVRHRHDVAQTEWSSLAPQGLARPAHLVVPLIVIDELDRLKSHGDVATVARATASALVASGMKPGAAGTLPARDDGRQGTGVSLLMELPGHRRVARADEEILRAAQTLAFLCESQISVTVLTFDLGMKMRADYDDVHCTLLPDSMRRVEDAVINKAEKQAYDEARRRDAAARRSAPPETDEPLTTDG